VEVGDRPEPPVGRALDESEDDERQTDSAGEEAVDVDTPAARCSARLGHPEDGAEQDQRPDGDVDVEDPAPVETRGEPAAEQGTDGGHPGHDRTPDAEGGGAVPAAEGRVDRRQGGRKDERASDSLEGARGDEGGGGVGTSGEDARGDEENDPGDEGPAASPTIADPPDGEEQRGEDHRVDRVDPLGVGQVEVQVGDDPGEGDAHDRAVEHDHRQAEGEDAE
jgi:hypothetical protein